VNHWRPSPKTTFAPNLLPPVVVVESVRLCGDADVNSNPPGCTVLPFVAPADGTLSTTVTDCGEFGTPGEPIRTWP